MTASSGLGGVLRRAQPAHDPGAAPNPPGDAPDAGKANAPAFPANLSEPEAAPMTAAATAGKGKSAAAASEHTPNNNGPVSAATPTGPDQEEGPLMAQLATVPAAPAPIEDPPADTKADIDFTVWLPPTAAVTVAVQTNGAGLVFDTAAGRIRIAAAPWHSGLRPGPALDILEAVCRRALAAIEDARNTRLAETVRQWPCAGVCSPATWQSASTWVCPEVDTRDGTTFSCGREEGHPGDHVACTKHEHAAHTWPQTKKAA